MANIQNTFTIQQNNAEVTSKSWCADCYKPKLKYPKHYLKRQGTVRVTESNILIV